MKMTDRAWAEVDLDIIRSNFESIHSRVQNDAGIAAVVKADGYGHGALMIAREAEELPYIWGHAVATYEEAAELRSGGIRKPVLILGYVFPSCYEELARMDIRPVVFRKDMLQQLSLAAGKTGHPIHVHVGVDTGMSRIGILPDQSGISFVREVLQTEGLVLEGMFTHFAKADEEDPEPTHKQSAIFRAFAEKIQAETGVRIPILHCDNSAGIITFPEYDMDMVRSGIITYGMWPSPFVSRERTSLLPALSLYTRIIYIKEIEAGTAVSYGGTCVAGRRIRVATLCIGYGDGYPRSLSSRGYVLIHGKRAAVLGRICMDQMMVDVTEIPEASEGDIAVLIGKDGELEITAEELGDLSGKFNYELICGLGKRIPRIYRKGGCLYSGDGKRLSSGED